MYKPLLLAFAVTATPAFAADPTAVASRASVSTLAGEKFFKTSDVEALLAQYRASSNKKALLANVAADMQFALYGKMDTFNEQLGLGLNGGSDKWAENSDLLGYNLYSAAVTDPLIASLSANPTEVNKILNNLMKDGDLAPQQWTAAVDYLLAHPGSDLYKTLPLNKNLPPAEMERLMAFAMLPANIKSSLANTLVSSGVPLSAAYQTALANRINSDTLANISDSTFVNSFFNNPSVSPSVIAGLVTAAKDKPNSALAQALSADSRLSGADVTALLAVASLPANVNSTLTNIFKNPLVPVATLRSLYNDPSFTANLVGARVASNPNLTAADLTTLAQKFLSVPNSAYDFTTGLVNNPSFTAELGSYIAENYPVAQFVNGIQKLATMPNLSAAGFSRLFDAAVGGTLSNSNTSYVMTSAAVTPAQKTSLVNLAIANKDNTNSTIITNVLNNPNMTSADVATIVAALPANNYTTAAWTAVLPNKNLPASTHQALATAAAANPALSYASGILANPQTTAAQASAILSGPGASTSDAVRGGAISLLFNSSSSSPGVKDALVEFLIANPTGVASTQVRTYATTYSLPMGLTSSQLYRLNEGGWVL